jgi:high-affinity iron transporter
MIKEKKMKRVPWMIIVGFLFSLFSFGPALAQAQKVPKKTPESLAQGKKLYDQYCLTCHGAKGDGKGPAGVLLKPPPRDFNIPLKQWTHSKGDLKKVFDVISKGVPNTAMVSWAHLSEQDRWALAYYVEEFSRPPKKK